MTTSAAQPEPDALDLPDPVPESVRPASAVARDRRRVAAQVRELGHGVRDELHGKLTPIVDLRHYPGNARTHDLPGLRESLSTSGQYQAITAQRSTGYVLRGNGTMEAAELEGWSHLAVDWLDVDDDLARRIVLVDNRSNDLAGYDNVALLALLDQSAAVDDLLGTMFSAQDLADLHALEDTLPDLDDLADGIGDPTDEDGLVRLSVRVEPDVLATWRRLMRESGEEREHEAAAVVVDRAARFDPEDG